MKRKKDKAVSKQHFLDMKAKERKDFVQNLKKVCATFDYPNLFEKLPKETLEKLFKGRIRSPHLTVAEGHVVSKELHYQVFGVAANIIRMAELPPCYGVAAVPLYIFLAEGVTMMFMFPIMVKEEDFPEAKQMITFFEKFVTEEYFNQIYSNIFGCFIFYMSSCFSELGKTLVWLTYEFEVNEKTMLSRYHFKMHCHKGKVFPLLIDGISRPTYRLEWYVEKEIVPIQIRPSELGLRVENDAPIDVFVQSHALKRLDERINAVAGIMHYWMFQSFLEPTFIKTGPNKFLVPFKFYGFKAGYFVLSIVEGKAVVRTFLFLTNTGTPEYLKLESLTGLQQADIAHLSINSLNDFVNSDLLSNETIGNIFKEAGCESLFDLVRGTDYLKDKATYANADYFLDYLDKGKAYREQEEYAMEVNLV